MTTVAALAVDGTVWMAADSCTNVYDRPIIGAARKLRAFTVAGTRGERLLLGFAGDGGIPDLLEATWLPADPPSTEHDQHSWVAEHSREITRLAVEAGFVQDGRLDAGILLGWRGRLWSLCHAQAVPIPDGIAAIGSGEGPAMGALDVLRSLDVTPGEAVVRAVTLACARDRYSEPPVYVESTD